MIKELNKNCEFCKKEFSFDKRKRKNPKYCSMKCYKSVMQSASQLFTPKVCKDRSLSSQLSDFIFNLLEKEGAKEILLSAILVCCLLSLWLFFFAR